MGKVSSKCILELEYLVLRSFVYPQPVTFETLQGVFWLTTWLHNQRECQRLIYIQRLVGPPPMTTSEAKPVRKRRGPREEP